MQERVKVLSDDLPNLPARFTDQSHAEAATSYADAAGTAYHAFLQRTEAAVHRLGDRNSSPAAEIIDAVSGCSPIRGYRTYASHPCDATRAPITATAYTDHAR